MRAKLKTILTGLVYGALFGFFSPVPGISAGTMAILLNIYDKIFANISFAAIRRNWLISLAVLVGWGGGLVGVSGIMVFLFYNFEKLVSYAFIGLVAGCLPSIYKKAAPDKPKGIALFVVALGAMVLLFIFGGDLAANSSIAQLGPITPRVLLWIFTAGLFSSMSMLIPGVGGSLMMIALGVYTIYLESIATFNLPILGVFVASMILGISIGAVITKILLNKNARLLYSAICGFIAGSLLIIFPGVAADVEMVFATLLAVGGFILSYKLAGVERG